MTGNYRTASELREYPQPICRSPLQPVDLIDLHRSIQLVNYAVKPDNTNISYTEMPCTD